MAKFLHLRRQLAADFLHLSELFLANVPAFFQQFGEILLQLQVLLVFKVSSQVTVWVFLRVSLVLLLQKLFWPRGKDYHNLEFLLEVCQYGVQWVRE